MESVTIGLDLANHVFQLHGIDEHGEVVLRRRLRRAQVRTFFAELEPCLIGIEACGTAYFWARELTGLGHEVRIIPPAYVKPYVRRNKNDAADAAAICEAVARPDMRFVPVKTEEQQAALMLHKGRDLLVREQTMLVNALRGHWRTGYHCQPGSRKDPRPYRGDRGCRGRKHPSPGEGRADAISGTAPRRRRSDREP